MIRAFLKALSQTIRRRIAAVLAQDLERHWRDQAIGLLKECGVRFAVQMPVCLAQPDSIEIGDDVSFAAYVHIWGGGGVVIGSRVMVGTHTSITSLTHDHGVDPMFNTVVAKPVAIEDDVWIGSNCTIMPGVTIGRGAVIGAGSVVTHDVKPMSIVAGVPARLIKMRCVNC